MSAWKGECQFHALLARVLTANRLLRCSHYNGAYVADQIHRETGCRWLGRYHVNSDGWLVPAEFAYAHDQDHAASLWREMEARMLADAPPEWGEERTHAG